LVPFTDGAKDLAEMRSVPALEAYMRMIFLTDDPDPESPP